MFLNTDKRKLNKRIEKFQNVEDIGEYLKERKNSYPTKQNIDQNAEDEDIALKSKQVFNY